MSPLRKKLEVIHIADKRSILRIHGTISQAYAGSVVENIIHKSTDSETLIRAIFNGFWTDDLPTVAGAKVLNWMFNKAPAGATVIAPTTSEAKDKSAPLELITEGGVRFFTTVSTAVGIIQSNPRPFMLDIKAQRKLKKDDELRFDAIASASDLIGLFCTYSLWLKQ